MHWRLVKEKVSADDTVVTDVARSDDSESRDGHHDAPQQGDKNILPERAVKESESEPKKLKETNLEQ